MAAEYITKEFLESALKKPIAKLVVNTGSSLGDGYTCVIYSVDVWPVAHEDEEPLHLILKCFPTNPARQQFLEEGGVFAIELGMYEEVIPALNQFLKEKNATDIRLPFAQYFAGRQTLLAEGSGNPLDNFLMMTDLRKTGGFSLRDRFQGLDLDHFKLVIEGQATLHAVSWAFKNHIGIKLREKFPSLTMESFSQNYENGVMDIFLGSVQNVKPMFKEDPRILEALDHISSVAVPMSKLYYGLQLKEVDGIHTKDSVLKIPNEVNPKEEPWQVLLHGDCWSNNLLFRYDSITGKPAEVIFIDLQLSHEGDQFADINYTLFANTSQDLRQKHFKSLMHHYYDTFTNICIRLESPLLPGWTWEEFNRRVHRGHIFGMYMSSVGLPIMLQNPKEVRDLDKVDMKAKEGDEALRQMMSEMLVFDTDNNPVLIERLRGVLEDGIKAGII